MSASYDVFGSLRPRESYSYTASGSGILAGLALKPGPTAGTAALWTDGSAFLGVAANDAAAGEIVHAVAGMVRVKAGAAVGAYTAIEPGTGGKFVAAIAGSPFASAGMSTLDTAFSGANDFQVALIPSAIIPAAPVGGGE